MIKYRIVVILLMLYILLMHSMFIGLRQKEYKLIATQHDIQYRIAYQKFIDEMRSETDFIKGQWNLWMKDRKNQWWDSMSKEVRNAK